MNTMNKKNKGDRIQLTNYDVVDDSQNLFTDKKIMNAFQWDSHFPSIIDKDVINFIRQLSDDQGDLYLEVEACFFDDVIMSLLNDAINEIIQYFNGAAKKTKIKKNPVIVNELFYDETTFRKIIDEYLNQFSFLDAESIFNKIAAIEDIHMQMPKITFQWSLFILNFTARSPGKNFNYLKRFLPLKWTGSNKPNEYQVFENAQEKFKAFIDILPCSKIEGMEFNQSLNLFAFNEVTNLYDLYNLIKEFKDNSNYMRMMQYQSGRLPYEIKYDLKNRILSRNGDMALFSALETKTFMVDELNKPILFEKQEYQDVFNRIFLGSKNSLREYIADNLYNNDDFDNIPEEIKVSYGVYRVFSNFEPYEYIIEDILEAGVDIYKPSSNDIENHLYEAYGFAYKILRDAKNRRG